MTPRTRAQVRAFVDYAGLAAFLVTFLVTRDLVTATWGLVAGSAVALAVGFAAERRLAPLPLVAGLAALIFGGLTIAFDNELFVKIKPTIMNLLFGALLLGGVAIGRNPVKALLGTTLSLPDPIWRSLAIRYGVFFLGVAALNEAVWRTQPTETWVWFRFPGLLVLTTLFSLAQAPLMMRHAKDRPEPPGEEA